MKKNTIEQKNAPLGVATSAPLPKEKRFYRINVIVKTNDTIDLEEKSICYGLYNYICTVYKGFENVNIITKEEFIMLSNRYWDGDLPF